MRILFAFLLFVVFHVGQGQIIENAYPNYLQDENYFSESFLANNNIRSITGKVSLKREMQPIHDLGILTKFIFNREGKLVEKIETFTVSNTRRDTTAIVYKYDDINQLIFESNPHQNAFDGIRYHYDSSGNLTQKDFIRGKNNSQFKYEFEEGKTYLVKSEKFNYSFPSERYETKVALNSDGNPYMKTTIEYDSLGNIISISDRLLVTNKKTEKKYTYNDKLQLIEYTESSNITQPTTYRYTYTYDELDNVYEESKYKNGILVQRRQFLFDAETSLLKAELIKNEKNGDIKIIQYEYEFFDTVTKTSP